MNFFKRIFAPKTKAALQSVDDRGWQRIFDWTPGAWQTHHPYDPEESVLAYPTVFACMTLIASDIGKLRPTVQQKTDQIWVDSPGPRSELLMRPNSYQDHIQFKQHWQLSKLTHGNTYAFKFREGQRVAELHILDPLKVTPLISDMGQVFYRLGREYLAGLEEDDLVVPASEIIHDRFNCLYHPLVGLSPIFAAGTSAQTGLTSQKDSRYFFANGAKPSGVLTAPGAISDSTANRIKEYWAANFSGKKAGGIAVMGDGLKYEPMRMTAVDAQLIEQLNWNDQKICSVFHVPAYKVGVGQMPTHNNIEALTQEYYTQCLQILIESMESALDQGLGLFGNLRVQLDLDGLFRMDTATQIDTLSKSVGSGIHSPDEARRKLNMGPVPGGQYPYMQQQNYSLEDLARRSEMEQQEPPDTEDDEDMDQALAMLDMLTKAVPLGVRH